METMLEMTDWENLTPAMKQYVEIKKKYPECILFFRMGDFFEIFFEDAEKVARTLEITLTKRAGIPLAGFPYYNLDPQLSKMISNGYKVAVCEQMEDPKTVKGRVVDRDVIRIVTPGTVVSPNMLNEKTNNYIMSIYQDPQSKKYGVALCDISTGTFFTSEIESKEKLITEIARFEPKECIIPSNSQLKLDKNSSSALSSLFISQYDSKYFSYSSSYKELLRHFNVLNLEGYGLENKDVSVISSGALMSYLNETQRGSTKQITNIRFFQANNFMALDTSTLRNLEITKNIRDGTPRGSLLSVFDRTTTAMGSRLLRQWMQQPLIDIKKINERLDAVEELTNLTIVREEVKLLLAKIYDVERLIARITNSTASPRDLISLRDSLKLVPRIKKELKSLNSDLFKEIIEMNELADIVNLIQESISDNPPVKINEGGIIKEKYNEKLDELREISASGKDFVAKMESQEKEKTGISALKVGFNRIHGYYIEVPRRFHDKVPSNYIRRQTLSNGERYVTEELKQKEELILGAEERINIIEFDLFNQITTKVSLKLLEIQEIAKNIAMLDVLICFSSVAVESNYVRPELHNGSEMFIENGRHPVIEKLQSEPYVPNDLRFDDDKRIMIITGPNMSGKSSFMRQIALIQLVSQTGSFVPASYAKLPVVDRIFTRVGAYDDLTMGQSTFMVEMTETANILNNASDRSLIILDEIGRGTSTFDGISLAWAIAEYIYERIKGKTLFATHYHQLNKLSDKYSGISNYNIAVREYGDEILFLRKIVEGGTDKSYGIHVAKLAGLPSDVIERSKELMKILEEEDEIVEKIHTQEKADVEDEVVERIHTQKKADIENEIKRDEDKIKKDEDEIKRERDKIKQDGDKIKQDRDKIKKDKEDNLKRNNVCKKESLNRFF